MPSAKWVFLASLSCLGVPYSAVEAAEYEPALPKGCHSISRVVDTTNGSSLPNNYEPWKRLRKFDIVCYANEITISQPMLSLGGDVTIIADTLKIESVIDSRAMFDRNSFDTFENDVQLTRWDIAKKTDKATGYKEYYNACYDCYKIDGRLFIPRMPDGLTAAQVGLTSDRHLWFRPSYPAPDVEINRASLRSGTIRIFARDIKLAPRTDTGGSDTPPCDKAFPDQRGRPVLIASGLNAGRGGIGAPAKCDGHGWCVPPGYLDTTVGAGPGRPGDAGDVIISVTGSQEHPDTVRKRIAQLTVTTPGQPQDRGLFLAPRGAATPDGFSATGSICDFFNPARQQGETSALPPGADGALAVARQKNNEALLSFTQWIQAREAWGGYDLTYQVSDENLARGSYFSLSDFIVYSNNRIIRSSFSRLAGDIKDSLVYGDKKETYYLPQYLRGSLYQVDTGSIPVSLRQSFTEVARFDMPDGGPNTALANMGGLFNIGSVSLSQQVFQNELQQQIAGITVELAAVRQSLINIDRSTGEQLYHTRRAEVAAEANALNAALLDLYKKIADEAVGGKAFFAKLSSGGQKIASGVAVLVAGTAAAPAYIVALYQIGQGCLEIRDALDVASFDQELSRLQFQIKLVKKAARDLEFDISEQRQRLTSEVQRLNDKKLGLAFYLERLSQRRSLQAADLVKVVMLGYVSDPARNVTDLESNLAGIESYLLSDATPSSFKWRDVNTSCSNIPSPDRCLALEDSSIRRNVYVDAQGVSGSSPILAYVVSKGFGNVTLPMFGYKARVVP